MAPIAVDPSVLLDASGRYEAAQADALRVIADLTSLLDAQWGCAGTDSAGLTWSQSYDPSAYDAVAAGVALVNAFAKIHDLLAFTGTNHADAENANITPPIPPGPDPAQLPSTVAPTFKGAYGGDTDAPFGWGLISRWLQGHAWPNGDPDKLRAIAAAWRSAATGLRDAAAITDPAWVALEQVVSEEISQALAQMDGVDCAIEEVAAQFESLATACADWASSIDDAHDKILAILAGAIGGGLVIGGVVGVLTAGTGTPFVEAGIGGSAGAAIVGVLVGFDGAAAAAVGATAAAGIAAGGVVRQVQPLLDAVPTRFDARGGGGEGNGLQYQPPPSDGVLPGFPEAKPIRKVGPRFRARWKDDKGNIFEWDYQHGTVEKYSKNGTHQGEFDPVSRAETKPAVPGRKPGG